MPALFLNDGLRFAVLSRDDFRCRYCGRRAPDVVLHVDHIIPRSRGGATEMENLATACSQCNTGKSAAELTFPGDIAESIGLAADRAAAEADGFTVARMMACAELIVSMARRCDHPTAAEILDYLGHRLLQLSSNRVVNACTQMVER